MRARVLPSMALWIALGAAAVCAQPPQPSPDPGKQAATLRKPCPANRRRAAASRGHKAGRKPRPSIGCWPTPARSTETLHAGEFRVAFTVTPAEGWWDKAGGGKLAWHDAPAYNVHLRIFVLDLADGRLVPGLHLRATLTDANGNQQAAAIAYGWYPLINAYGGNVPLDADSSYTLRVAIDRDAKDPADADPSQEHLTRTTVAEFAPVAIVQNDVMLLPLATANVSTADEAELLKPYDDALSAAITALWQQSASGAEQPSGDYFVAYALGAPAMRPPVVKNLFEFSGKDNVQLEVPGARFAHRPPHSRTPSSGQPRRRRWHGLRARGAGSNPAFLARPITDAVFALSRKATYTLSVSFDAPGFRRWGRQSDRFAAPAEVEFDNVSLKPEASKSEASQPEGK